ncbi:hypothetical protein PFISCL1PPCAC_4651, partial [Pristionchus fissidentatus]
IPFSPVSSNRYRNIAKIAKQMAPRVPREDFLIFLFSSGFLFGTVDAFGWSKAEGIRSEDYLFYGVVSVVAVVVGVAAIILIRSSFIRFKT